MTWTSPHAALVLASPRNGLLFWTPVALPALAGLIWLALRGRSRGNSSDSGTLGWICLFMVATQIYVSGSLDTWAAAGSFGQRRLIGLSVFLVIGLATVLAASRGWMRYAVYAFAALAVWWNVGLTAQFGTGVMSRQHLDPPANAYHTFVTIPRRLPELVYRYALDRESFYQPSASR